MRQAIRIGARLSVFCLAFGLAVEGQPLQAQEASVPRVIQFSGVLRDSVGQALTGVQGVSFALYRDQEGGSPLWIETQNVAADEYGRFAVLLGAASGGVPIEMFSSGESRWLGVQAIQSRDRDGAVLPEQPRVSLVSVPYALKAADAETLGGLPASAFLLAPSIVTERVKDSGGLTGAAVTDDGPLTAAVTAGTAGRIGKFINATDLGDSVLFESLGKIGLGTTSPSDRLHLVETGPGLLRVKIESQSTQQFSTAGFTLRLSEVADANTEWHFYVSKLLGGAATGPASFQIRRRNASQTEALTPFQITASGNVSHVILQSGFQAGSQQFGNVGIGTANPTTKLHVVGDVTATKFLGDGSMLTGIASTGGANTFTGLQTINGSVNTTSTSTADFSSAVTGSATGASGQTRGVVGTTNSTADAAIGVAGQANGASGATFGVFGVTASSSNSAAGVHGLAAGAGGVTSGVFGTTNSNTTGAAGVFGVAGNAGGQVYGVAGQTNSATDFAVGVQGGANAATGNTAGVQGYTNSTTDGAVGVEGEANGATGNTVGVRGRTSSNTTNAAGVVGIANNSNFNADPSVGDGVVRGVQGNTNSVTNGAIGVLGTANNAGTSLGVGPNVGLGKVTGVEGRTNSITDGAVGVRGNANNSGNSPNGGKGAVIGVQGNTNSITDFASGVAGNASGTTGQTYGVSGFTNSSTGDAAGVFGGAFNDALGVGISDGRVYGVEGRTNSIHDNAAGVRGLAFGATGETFGVVGDTDSTTNGAAGVAGSANGDTGWTFGVIGEISSSTENAAGVAGVSSDSGATSGVIGIGVSSSATAGTFLNLSGTGPVLSGRSGNTGGFDVDGFPLGPFPEVFRVEGDGDVVATTGDFQALAAGKGLILKSPNGTTCARISIDNAGALVTTVLVSCP